LSESDGNGELSPEELVNHTEWERQFVINMAEKGKLASMKEEHLFILISALKQIPGKRLEIDLPGKGEPMQLQMEFRPNKLILSLKEASVIQVVQDLPSGFKQ
jgi:hypothetical protein